MAGRLLMGTLGDATMYFFDPRLGRRRRALLRDKLIHTQKRAVAGIELGTRDLAHRLQGLAASLTPPCFHNILGHRTISLS